LTSNLAAGSFRTGTDTRAPPRRAYHGVEGRGGVQPARISSLLASVEDNALQNGLATWVMNTFQPGNIRNFAIVGHASSGKTMLSEAMLACSGVINRLGSISAGTTVSDYHVSEKDHQISVHASLMHTEWMGRKFNIIDTPGYADFISEGLGALRVGDFALVVVSAHHGV